MPSSWKNKNQLCHLSFLPSPLTFLHQASMNEREKKWKQIDRYRFLGGFQFNAFSSCIPFFRLDGVNGSLFAHLPFRFFDFDAMSMPFFLYPSPSHRQNESIFPQPCQLLPHDNIHFEVAQPFPTIFLIFYIHRTFSSLRRRRRRCLRLRTISWCV